MTPGLIKNIHLLTDIVKPGDLEKLEHAAREHKRYSNITFKINEVTDHKVLLQVSQGKSAQGNYQTAKRLIEIVHETFDRFFLPERKIIAGPIVYKVPAPNKVTVDWIVQQMKETKTRLKQIADDTGLDYTHLSSLTSGNEPLSQPMKALFWYYFLSKG